MQQLFLLLTKAAFVFQLMCESLPPKMTANMCSRNSYSTLFQTLLGWVATLGIYACMSAGTPVVRAILFFFSGGGGGGGRGIRVGRWKVGVSTLFE